MRFMGWLAHGGSVRGLVRAVCRGVCWATCVAMFASCAEEEKLPAFADPTDAVLASQPDAALRSDMRPANSLTGNDLIDVCTRLHWTIAYSLHLSCVRQWWQQNSGSRPPALAPTECRSFVSTCERNRPGDDGGSHGWYDAAYCSRLTDSSLFRRCAPSVTVAEIAECFSDIATTAEARYDTLSCDTDASWLFDKSSPPTCRGYVTCW